MKLKHLFYLQNRGSKGRQAMAANGKGQKKRLLRAVARSTIKRTKKTPAATDAQAAHGKKNHSTCSDIKRCTARIGCISSLGILRCYLQFSLLRGRGARPGVMFSEAYHHLGPVLGEGYGGVSRVSQVPPRNSQHFTAEVASFCRSTNF